LGLEFLAVTSRIFFAHFYAPFRHFLIT